MSTDVTETPLFAQIAGDQAERIVALIADPPPPSSIQELLARYPNKS
jgi:hypothetical protein